MKHGETSAGRRALRRKAVQRLTDAERARTMIAGAFSVRVGVGVMNMDHDVPRHAVAPDGSVLFAAPSDSPAQTYVFVTGMPEQTVNLTVQDVAHVAQADRLRGTLVLSGSIEPVSDPLPEGLRAHLAGSGFDGSGHSGTVLRLVPTRVWLHWACEDGTSGSPTGVEVPCDEYQAAAADPLLEAEEQVLQHLFDGHRDLLRGLAVRADPVLGAKSDARPIALDRYGVVLRLYLDGTHHDRRVLFGRPAGCGCELQQEFDLLRQDLSARSREID